MKKTISFILTICSFFTLSSFAAEKETKLSLRGNHSIPHSEIRNFFEKEAWDVIKDMPYDACVVLEGCVNRDNSIDIRKINDSYPNEKRNKIARKLCENVQVTATTVGTRVKPRAKIYVLFYEKMFEPNRAIVFAKRKEETQFSDNAYRDQYMMMYEY